MENKTMKSKIKLLTLGLASILLITSCTTVGNSSSLSSTTSGTSSDSSTTTTTSEAQTFQITVGETNGVELNIEPLSAQSGQRVDVDVVSVPDGKQVQSVKVDVSDVTVMQDGSMSYYFLMPNQDVTISCITTDVILDTYPLTVVNESDSEEIIVIGLKDSMEVFPSSENVYDLEPNESYFLKVNGASTSLSVTLDDTQLSQSEGYFTFTMPAKAATLKISPIASYSVNLVYDSEAFDSEGIILIDEYSLSQIQPSSVTQGTNVYMQISPKFNYEVVEVTLDGRFIENNEGYRFTMPNHDVTVNIKTEVVTSDSYLVNLNVDDSIDTTFYRLNNGQYEEILDFYAPTSRFESGTTIYFKASIKVIYDGTYEIDDVLIDNVAATENDDGYYSITFADKDVNLSITAKYIYYSIVFDPQDSNATATICDEDGNIITTAHRNQQVTVTFENGDLLVDKVYFNGDEMESWEGKLNGNVLQFSMVKEDLTITVTWKN